MRFLTCLHLIFLFSILIGLFVYALQYTVNIRFCSGYDWVLIAFLLNFVREMVIECMSALHWLLHPHRSAVVLV